MPEEPEAWVVYRVSAQDKHGGGNAVCPQQEWEAMEQARPGYHTLGRDHTLSEGEAERLARGTSGDARNAGALKKVSERK
jgi:hypothetical protein